MPEEDDEDFENPEDIDSNKQSKNSSKGCVVEVDLEYSEEICELHND